jgi:hypothetical protein
LFHVAIFALALRTFLPWHRRRFNFNEKTIKARSRALAIFASVGGSVAVRLYVGDEYKIEIDWESF